jgi:nucleoside-diphosphate-sugar epimerase
MRALITGASGFIGSSLIEELNRLGFEVHALMRSTSSRANLEGMRYERIEGDLSDYESLKRAVKDKDYVFHLAGMTAAPNREAFLRCNAQGTAELARAVAEAAPGLTRFVYVSSLAAGGPARSKSPRLESDPPAPVSAYGESKLQGEVELLKYKSRFPVAIVRPPLVYGPKDKGVFVLIQTIARNLMPIPSGKGEGGHKFYSAVHVKDLCRGVVQAALAPADKVPSGEIFYVCEDDFHAYEDFLRTIADNLGLQPFRFKVPMPAIRLVAAALTGLGKLTGRSYPFNLDKLNEILPDYWICSNEKAKRVLGFVPEYPLAKGMKETIAWYKKNDWI